MRMSRPVSAAAATLRGINSIPGAIEINARHPAINACGALVNANCSAPTLVRMATGQTFAMLAQS